MGNEIVPTQPRKIKRESPQSFIASVFSHGWQIGMLGLENHTDEQHRAVCYDCMYVPHPPGNGCVVFCT